MLKNDVITLRAPEPSDLEFLYEIENNIENWKVSETVVPFSKALLKQFVFQTQDIYATRQFRWMITDKNNNSIGCVDIYDFDASNRRAGLGILIHKDFHRQQFAFNAINLLEPYLKKHLKLHQVYCLIHENNLPSVRLFEKLCFVKNGVKKDWYFDGENFENILFFQKIL